MFIWGLIIVTSQLKIAALDKNHIICIHKLRQVYVDRPLAHPLAQELVNTYSGAMIKQAHMHLCTQ